MGSSTTVVSRRRTQAPKPGRTLRKRSKSRIMAEGDNFSNASCQKCGSGEYPAQLLLCDKCDCGFHLFCLRPILASVPEGSWFCPSCDENQNLNDFSLVQTKIVDFFRIQRPSISSNEPSPSVKDCQKKRKRSSLVMSKKRRRLLPFIPTKDPARREEQMASLATALLSVGADFSNELTYMPGMAPRSANQAALEREGMQVLSKDDTETLNLCNNMMKQGEWPPLMVIFDLKEGFTVQADVFIKDWTIITEYVGDVDYFKNREADDGNSMMTLLTTNDPSKDLVICPDERSNIARFINGINNHTPEGKKKRNVKCVRYDVNGECRVLLIASRDIRKGERLYYDYNGYENEYPTEDFV